MSVLASVPVPGHDEVAERLTDLLRPEFRLAVLRPDPGDPVFAGSPCAVAACERPARSHGLCAAHHARWVGQAKPDLPVFIRGATPVRHDHRPRADEVFDLSLLPERCRLELAYVLQRRHDERGKGLRPADVRPVVAVVASSDVPSLLDRPVEQWIAMLPRANRTALAGATGFLRYAWRELDAVVEGAGSSCPTSSHS